MTNASTSAAAHLRTAIATGLAALLLASSAVGAGRMTVGVVVPRVQLTRGSAADFAEPVRASLITSLRSASIDVVVLDATEWNQSASEAAAKHCSHVLYTRIQQQSGGGGLFHRLAAATSALSAHGGGLAQARHETLPPASKSQGQDLSTMIDAERTAIRRADTITVEYRLIPVGGSTPVASKVLQATAAADGEDVLSPLIAQLGLAVSTAASDRDTAAAGPVAAATAGADAVPPPSRGGQSLLGSFFGRHEPPHRSATQRTSPGSSVDCARMAAMPGAPMSREACEQLMASERAYESAASDPSAARPGDDTMTCDQIMRELQAQSYQGPDKAKVAELGSAVKAEQTINAKQQGQAVTTAVAEQAALTAASAADTATEVATGGAVRGRAVVAVTDANAAANKAISAQMLAERHDTDTKLTGSAADMATAATQQLTANPRIARLMQLASARRCKRSAS